MVVYSDTYMYNKLINNDISVQAGPAIMFYKYVQLEIGYY